MAKLFLMLGTTAFGGPAAHIARMEDKVVRRRQWLTCDEFLGLLEGTNLIPGPNSTEMAIHIVHRRARARLLTQSHSVTRGFLQRCAAALLAGVGFGREPKNP